MGLPASKTAIAECVHRLDAKSALAGLRANPGMLDYRDERGRTWLHLCASINARKKQLPEGRAIPLAKGLIELGLDINDPAFTEGTWQATPLWYAVARGENRALAKFLLEAGSAPDHCLWAAAFREDLSMLKLLLGHGAPLEAVAEGETPLLGAVKVSKFKAAEFLLAAGADPDYRDATGMTALHCMLKKNSDLEHYNMFISHRARGDLPDREGRTAIELMQRKRDRRFHEIAAKLATGRRSPPGPRPR